MAFLDDLATRIEEQGAGTLGVDLFLSSSAQIPSGDGPYTVLTEWDSESPLIGQPSGAISRPRASIVVYAASYVVARQRCVEVRNALGGGIGLYSVVINGTFYLSLVAYIQIRDIGTDALARARVRFVIQAEVDYGVVIIVPPLHAPAFDGNAFSSASFATDSRESAAFDNTAFSPLAFPT